MKQRYFNPRLLQTSLGLIFLNLLIAQPAAADTFNQIIGGFSRTGSAAGYPLQGTAPKYLFAAAFSNYINGMLTLIGALFFVLVLYGGWLWMTAQGKEEQVEKAKTMIINAIIGLGVIIGARLIVELALRYVGCTLPGQTC